ncbi:MAG: PAAR domain-containing protein [Planctomycetota bacterium]
MPPAARVTDNHVCPLADPKPHVGGPISSPGAPTVLIAKLPAATAGSMCTCTGPPDTIVKGSATVLLSNKPAARVGDTCAHGGTVVMGQFNVMIGG